MGAAAGTVVADVGANGKSATLPPKRGRLWFSGSDEGSTATGRSRLGRLRVADMVVQGAFQAVVHWVRVTKPLRGVVMAASP